MTIQKAMEGFGVPPRDLEPLFHQVKEVPKRDDLDVVVDAEFREIPALPPGFAKKHGGRVKEAKKKAKAPKTIANYANGLAQFSQWCRAEGCVALPAHPDVVGAYLSARYDAGMSIGTVRLDCVSIGHAHRKAKLEDPTRDPGLKETVPAWPKPTRSPRARHEP